ncbi:MAG: SpoIIE family protein phosphatase [Chloroherpetonaceae bacterium]|nr:SpoIIE family protein phosphatase [Chloroherpetonaceae bacterium]
MQTSSRLTYIFLALVIVCEASLLLIDIGLFYAHRARVLSGGLYVLKDLIAIVMYAVLYYLIRMQLKRYASPDSPLWLEPAESFWKGFTSFGLLLSATVVLGWLLPRSGYDTQSPDGFWRAMSLQTVFKTHLITLGFGSLLLASLVVLERLIFFRRAKNTQSNFLAMVVLMLVASLSEIGSLPQEIGNPVSIAFAALAIVMMLVNAFRLSWVLPLSRSDKIRTLFLVIGILAELVPFYAMDCPDYFLAYSGTVGFFLSSITTFVAIYLATTLFSLLSYLPTSEALERKNSEVRNLYAMSRFASEVFDEEKIYSSLVSYACSAAGASSCGWLDLYQPFDEKSLNAEQAPHLPNLQWKTSKGYFKTVVRQNVSTEHLHEFAAKAHFLWEEMCHNPRQIRVDDIETDSRIVKDATPLTNFLRRLGRKRRKEPAKIVSTLSVPLISRANLIGVLTVAKDVEYGFVKDDVELISTFADQAAIAIQNSRLVREVIDKERMQQELAVAQKIQLRLLPHTPLAVPNYEMDSLSYPAFEVGGDFYDYLALSSSNGSICKFGVMIADVSGKGASAAFYTAELKGIFQSLCTLYPDTPSDLLIRANETLSRSLDRKSFVSALYAIFDVHSHTVRFSNAGHCPMVLLTAEGAQLVKVPGLALGLNAGDLFQRAIRTETLFLKPGDAVVFYTDGLIDAVNSAGEPFGFERLLTLLSAHKHRSASEIKQALFEAVNTFAGAGGSVKDDLTILVIKRCDTPASH